MTSGPNDSPELDPFERFWAAYPNKSCKGYARSQWMWALNQTGNDYERIIAGAVRAAEYHAREGTERRFILRPDRWLQAWGWEDTYDLPKAPVQSPHEAEIARLTALADKWWPRGVTVTRFVTDWRRNRITEADKRAIVQCGIRTADEVAA